MPQKKEFRQFLGGANSTLSQIAPDGQNNYTGTIFSPASRSVASLQQMFRIPSWDRPIADLSIDELLDLEKQLSDYIASGKTSPLALPRANDIRSHIRAYIRCIEEKIGSCRKSW